MMSVEAALFVPGSFQSIIENKTNNTLNLYLNYPHLAFLKNNTKKHLDLHLIKFLPLIIKKVIRSLLMGTCFVKENVRVKVF